MDKTPPSEHHLHTIPSSPQIMLPIAHFYIWPSILLPFVISTVFWPFFPLAASSFNQHCYSCTTLNADRLLAQVADPNWRKWLQQIRLAPRSRHCADPFITISALRNGVRSLPCENGLCLKLWFQEANSDDENDEGQVWRSCVPHGNENDGILRADCTRIESSQGKLSLCTCDGPLCNGSLGQRQAGIGNDLNKIFAIFVFLLVILKFS